MQNIKSQSKMNATYILLTSYSVYWDVSGSHRNIREQNGNGSYSYYSGICFEECCDT